MEEHAATAQSLAERVEEIVRPAIADLGFETIRVECLGQRSVRLQIMIERADGGAMTLDDCARVSQAVSPLLDVEDVIPGSYTLEVSSPGIDRPLVRLADFDRFAGFEAKVELARPLAGQRRFRGLVRGTDGDMVRLDTAEGPACVPYADIRRAKLVLTDELIRASGSKSQRDAS